MQGRHQRVFRQSFPNLTGFHRTIHRFDVKRQRSRAALHRFFHEFGGHVHFLEKVEPST